MKRERIYVVFLVFSVIAYALIEIMKPKPVDWSPDFTKNNAKPYATEILYNELGTLFPNSEILENEQTLFKFEQSQPEQKNWIFLNNTITFDQFESEILLDQISMGDQVFIVASIFGFLADTLNLKYDYYDALFDSTFLSDSISVNFKNTTLSEKESWNFDADISFYYLTSYDSSRTTELGTWQNGKLNFIRMNIGDGILYLNTTPFLFTNYYLRNPNYAKYAFTALSHLPVQNTIWDGYYKTGNVVLETPMYVILSTESLKYAWYVAIVTLIVFMIFRAKRKQRIIPILSSPENSTVQFTETIGLLYLEKGSHKDILEKKIQFFLDYIKTHLQLDIQHIDDRFKIDLAFRSGIPKKEVVKLFDLMELIKASKKISDSQLKKVTDQIDQFYKQTQR